MCVIDVWGIAIGFPVAFFICIYYFDNTYHHLTLQE